MLFSCILTAFHTLKLPFSCIPCTFHVTKQKTSTIKRLHQTFKRFSCAKNDYFMRVNGFHVSVIFMLNWTPFYCIQETIARMHRVFLINSNFIQQFWFSEIKSKVIWWMLFKIIANMYTKKTLYFDVWSLLLLIAYKTT